MMPHWINFCCHVKMKALYVTDESVDFWHVAVGKYSWRLSMFFVCLPYRKLNMGLEEDINGPKYIQFAFFKSWASLL